MPLLPRGLLVDTTPLRVSPAYRRLWWSLGLSNLGTQLTVVAVGLQVYAITGSSLAVGVLGIFALVPLVLLGLYGGALVDLYDRRRVALVSAFVLWGVTGLVAAQAWLHLDSVGVLYGLVAVQSAASAVHNPARQAIVPRLLEPRLIPAANALSTLTWNVALTVGPLAAAALIAVWDYAEAYTIDAVLFTAALWAVWKLPALPPEPADPQPADPQPADPQPADPQPADPQPADSGRPAPPATAVPASDTGGKPRPRRPSGLASVVDGLRYLGTQRNVRTTFVVDLVAMVLAMPRVLFPAAGVLYLGGGEVTTGVLTAGIAIGGIAAGLFSGGLSRVRWQGRIIVWAITAWGLSVALFGGVLVTAGRTTPDSVLGVALTFAFLALVVAGASDAISAVFRQTILQTATPDAMRGRLQGVFTVVVAGGPRLGDVALGAGASRVGEGWAAVIGGLLCVVVLWFVVRRTPRFWAYDSHHPEP
ncbi:transmembrane secretion effector [Sediminihabitans luteus]|uniref:Transmembrane secretion effector n=1 Tax=Sediminihabitans luteus TaxID=1138585 RepID=A0A2M9CC86_9CELL|nr:MFS transporter [Sediminihabitans luteus]PJJ68618.1 transmembrane secretion effector [Sediminihabitans luteus]GII99956.1 MFS transporter [Sediminihabitans luteus]